jgi:hypothetical protein
MGYDLGVKEILQTVKELVNPTNPYMRQESDRIAKEGGRRAKWFLTKAASPMAAVIPGVTIKGLNEELNRERDEFGGLGPGTMGAAGDAASKAVSLAMFQKAIQGAGAANKAMKSARGGRGLLTSKASQIKKVNQERARRELERGVNEAWKKFRAGGKDKAIKKGDEFNAFLREVLKDPKLRQAMKSKGGYGGPTSLKPGLARKVSEDVNNFMGGIGAKSAPGYKKLTDAYRAAMKAGDTAKAKEIGQQIDDVMMETKFAQEYLQESKNFLTEVLAAAQNKAGGMAN